MRLRCSTALLAGWAFLQLFSGPAAAADELSCKAFIRKPRLDFEFRFFTGYSVEIPIKELAGPSRSIALAVLVTPLTSEGAEPVGFSSQAITGDIPADIRGKIEINGSFVVGEGRYRVEWGLRDAGGKSCRLVWEIEAKLRRKDRDVRMSMAPSEVGDSRIYLFRPERAHVDRSLGRPLRVKVFLNFDPWRRRRRASVRLFEFAPRIAALRALSRHPRVGELSLVAFSFEEQRILHRHGLQDHFNYAPLRDALEKLTPALVSIDQLGKYKQRDFFTDMLLDELPSEQPVDAYIFIGPDAEFGRKAPPERLAEIGRLDSPVFAMVSSRAPWKGLIGNAVKAFEGKSFRFIGPRDLAEALEDILERIEPR